MTSNGRASPWRARRRVLAACGLALALPAVSRSQQFGPPPIPDPPQPGDWLAFAFGPRANEPIAPADVRPNTPQIVAFPMDPATGAVRNMTRLNQVLVVRLDPAALSEATRARAADGIVAYSGVCTHTGCDVTDWNAEAARLKCPCHESEFEPRDGARVVGGPAPWQLAALPLAIDGGRLTVAGGFEGRVGFAPPGSAPFGA